ncbi:MAG: hypothetical protein EOO42_14995 [Flavobacteriales bacterium]|nr:MAG: hypothetical protein EOO42_14995 [Flavobacteriales bacterium]
MKINLKRSLLSITLILSATISYSQSVQDVSGKVYKAKSTNTLNGSTFIFNQFLNGELKLIDNKEIKTVNLNYDALDNLVLYKDKDGTVKEVAEPISSFVVNDVSGGKEFKRNFLAIAAGKENSIFYEVLYQKEFSILKRVIKYIEQESGYNAGSGEATVKEKTNYFKYQDGKLTSITKNQKGFLNLFQSNQQLAKAYIELKKLNLNKDEDIAFFLLNIDDVTAKN